MTDSLPTLDELRTIRMILETRRSAHRHWAGLVIWGVPGLVASIASHWLLVTERDDYIGGVWVLFWVAGTLCSALYLIIERRSPPRVVTFASRVLDAAWNAVIVTMMLLLSTGALAPAHIPGAIALMLAIGLCVMGAVLEFRPLYAAAVLWWTGGLVMMKNPREAFAIEAALIVLGYLLPAALLWRNVKRDDAALAAD